MNEEAYVARRWEAWGRLRYLCDKADHSPSALDAAELREFLGLYREASTDLATLRTRSANEGLIHFLNDLVARGYAIVYRAPRVRFLPALRNAVEEVARTGRRLTPFALVSSFIIFGAAFLVYFLLHLDVIPPEAIPGLSGGNTQQWANGDFPSRSTDSNVLASAFYMSNNPRVAIITAAIGAGTFGISSAILLFQNGALAGGVAEACARTGRADFFLSSIFPHGVPEISGIILSGAVAMRLGWALISPGVRTRGASLRYAGRDAGIGLLASVALMFIAAPIEGFFSFDPGVPGWLKTIVGIVQLILWGLFWTRVGREPALASATRSGRRP
ncbi:MAG: hypothetical protein C4321_07120 [Chloroflexota bacterium]